MSNEFEAADEATSLLPKTRRPEVITTNTAYHGLSLRRFIVPQRIIMALMGFLGMVVAYCMRLCLNMSLVMMVGTEVENEADMSDVCPVPKEYGNMTSTAGEFDWSPKLQGFILSIFFYGYVISQVPAGILAERHGGKNVYGLAILGTSILTLFSPVTIEFAGPYALMVLKFFDGIVEGGLFPGISMILATWIPTKERSIIGSFMMGGSLFGIVMCNSISGELLSHYNWRVVFYIFGSVGIVWCIIYQMLCHNNPYTHPLIKDKERQYLMRELGQLKRDESLKTTPWRYIVRSVPLWALVIGQMGHDFSLYIMMMDMPKYMNEVLHIPIRQNGFYSAMPYVSMWLFAIVSGIVSDGILAKGWLSLVACRKLFTMIAACGTALFMILIGYAGCNRTLIIAYFTLGVGLEGISYCSVRINPLDLSPNYAGTVMGIVNGFGGIGGIVGPPLVGILTVDQTISSWRAVFWITATIVMLCSVIFVIFGSASVQHWNHTDTIEQRPPPEA